MPKAKSQTQSRSPRRLHGVVKPRPSNKPQQVEQETTWYYEKYGSITVIHWCKDAEGKRKHACHIEIPWKLLMQSARRCRPEELKAA